MILYHNYGCVAMYYKIYIYIYIRCIYHLNNQFYLIVLYAKFGRQMYLITNYTIRKIEMNTLRMRSFICYIANI